MPLKTLEFGQRSACDQVMWFSLGLITPGGMSWRPACLESAEVLGVNRVRRLLEAIESNRAVRDINKRSRTRSRIKTKLSGLAKCKNALVLFDIYKSLWVHNVGVRFFKLGVQRVGSGKIFYVHIYAHTLLFNMRNVICICCGSSQGGIAGPSLLDWGFECRRS